MAGICFRVAATRLFICGNCPKGERDKHADRLQLCVNNSSGYSRLCANSCFLDPVSFWFFSIGGGLTLFIYALYRIDPVFILGQGAGLFVYLRNLYLIRRKQSGLAAASA